MLSNHRDDGFTAFGPDASAPQKTSIEGLNKPISSYGERIDHRVIHDIELTQPWNESHMPN